MPLPILAKDKFNKAIQVLKPSTVQNAATNTSTSTAISNAVGADTIVIRILVSTDSYVQIAAAPTASSATMYMSAGVPEYFRIDGNASMKVAALAVSSAGVLSVTEMV